MIAERPVFARLVLAASWLESCRSQKMFIRHSVRGGSPRFVEDDILYEIFRRDHSILSSRCSFSGASGYTVLE